MLRIVAGILAGWLAAGPVEAQEPFPARPIDLIVTFGPGGGADLMARTLARLAEPLLGVPIRVSNVAGASGNEGLGKLTGRPPDGYTVATLVGLSVASWAAGLGAAKPDDFAIVAWAQNSPSMLFVPRQSPFATIQDLLGHAKANPRALKVATSGFGTDDDVALRSLASLGYPMVNIPFPNPVERYRSTVDLETDALYEEPGDVTRYVSARQLRPLVVFDDVRHYAFPTVTTSQELGIDVGNLYNFRALVVRAGTPGDRIRALTGVFDKALQTTDWGVFCVRTYTCIRKEPPENAMTTVIDFHRTVKRHLDSLPR
ncbi:MAG: tripartite tricarboxylate transporter substrate binding protein [Rhodospirillales bacterium]|nr:tripartite tricarboxylate transporter substrate binding protein [Rhodospirillales bacterium]